MGRAPRDYALAVRATVRFRLPDGDEVELGHGALIGRLWSADLYLDDARVSEAHAMVSLRGEALHLLALRRPFAIEQRPCSQIQLRVGLVAELAQGLGLEVLEINLPSEILGIEAEGLPAQVVHGVCSLSARPRPRVSLRYEGDASAWVWSTGEGHRLQLRDERPRPLRIGESWQVDGVRYRAVALPLTMAGEGVTLYQSGVHPKLKLVARYESAHLLRPGEPPVVLSGMSARILSELVALGRPVPWEVLAGEIWPKERDRYLLRRRWDTNLGRLRQKLRKARIRDDLVRSDRGGHVELFLHPGDQVEDEA